MSELDFSEFELTNDPQFLQLNHPTRGTPLFEQMDDPEKEGHQIDDPTKPVGVFIVSSDSELFKKHMRGVQNKNLADSGIGRRNKMPTAEQIENDAETTLAACITKFQGIAVKGVVLQAPNDSRRFIQMFPHFREQIDKGMADRQRFMPALSKS